MSNGYQGLQLSLKDSAGALLNITGATQEEFLTNLRGLSGVPELAGFFGGVRAAAIGGPTQTVAQVAENLGATVAPTPAPAPVAAAKSVQQPNAPASDKQIALIRQKGGTVAEGLTKGQASALIDSLIKKG